MTVRAPIAVIRINDQEFSSDQIRKLKKVTYTQRDRKADTGELTFEDNDNFFIDSRILKKNKEFTLLLGWVNEMEPRGPFIVKSYKKTYPENGNSEFNVTFQDRSQRLNRQQRRSRRVNVYPHQIVQEIAETYGLSAEIESIDDVRFTEENPHIQSNQTDGRMLQQLAERYGYIWGIEGNTLYFRRPVDREQIGEQVEVPVLSYKCNDYSIKSFTPDIKSSSGRRRRASRQTGSNIDLLNGNNDNLGIFNFNQARETVAGSLPRLGEAIGISRGEQSDDTEPPANEQRVTDTQSNTQNQRQERSGRFSVDNITQAFGRLTSEIENDENNRNEESEPGNESATATPDNENEANRQAAGRVVRASEIVEGTVRLSVASMRWRPSMSVILAGLGTELSGRYIVKEVNQTVSVSDTFKTELKVRRQTFRASSQATQQIADATDTSSSSNSGSNNSSEGQPQRTTQQEARVQVDAIRQRFSRTIRVNGQEQ